MTVLFPCRGGCCWRFDILKTETCPFVKVAEKPGCRFDGFKLTHRLHGQNRSDDDEAPINVFSKVVHRQAVIHDPSGPDGWNGHGQRQQIVVRYRGRPKALPPKAQHPKHAGRKKVALQRGAKVPGRPAAHGSVDGQRRPIHAVGATQNPGHETATHEPRFAVRVEFRRVAN